MTTPKLPATFGLISPYNNKYLAYVADDDAENQGLLKFSAEDVSILTKFLVENAGDGLVHIKCAYNNKYLRRWSPNQYWIAAEGDTPEEDQSKWTCTLFKPVFANYGDDAKTLQLWHVQLGRYVSSRVADPEDYRYCLFAATKASDDPDLDIFAVTDFAPPAAAAPAPAVTRPTTDVAAAAPAPVVTGDISSKTPSSAVVKPDDHDYETIAPVGDRRSAVVGKDYQEPGKKLIKSKIVVVGFDFKKAKIRKTPIEGYLEDGVAIAMNPAKENREKLITFEYSITELSTWKVGTDSSSKSSAITTVISQIPMVIKNEPELTGDKLDGAYELGETLETTYKVKTTYNVVMRPMKMLSVELQATEATLNVPFSYKQVDTFSDRTVVEREIKHDGMYKGVHLFNFTYTSEETARKPTPK